MQVPGEAVGRKIRVRAVMDERPAKANRLQPGKESSDFSRLMTCPAGKCVPKNYKQETQEMIHRQRLREGCQDPSPQRVISGGSPLISVSY
jgi:hypothetical protein